MKDWLTLIEGMAPLDCIIAGGGIALAVGLCWLIARIGIDIVRYQRDLRRMEGAERGVCRVCGCTEDDRMQCIRKTGEPCRWVDESHTLCSACTGKEARD